MGQHPPIRPPGFPHMPFPPSNGGPPPGPFSDFSNGNYENYHHDFTGSNNFLPPGGPYPPNSGMDMTSLENMANYHDGPHRGESPSSSCSGNGGNPLHAFPSPPPQTQDFSSSDFPPGENNNGGGIGGQNSENSTVPGTEQCYPSPPLSLEYSSSPATSTSNTTSNSMPPSLTAMV